MSTPDETAARLVELGFSQYDARAYVGLLGQEPLTGYALSNVTGIPQPKVYETLRRLTARGAVVKVGDSPARFAAVAADQLLGHLETDFRRRVSDARYELNRFVTTNSAEQIRPLRSMKDRTAIITRARGMLADAERHVYLSGRAEELEVLGDEAGAAADRGVTFDVLCFGTPPFELPGRTLRHASTEGVVYRHHQARHLAIVADGEAALWALAPDGKDWDCMWVNDPLFAALVKGYVRHDMYVQQIYTDLGDALNEQYGPGLAGLTGISEDRPATPAKSAPRTRKRAPGQTA
ncbi:helix-turn-helix domain-containing protein [Streptomyces sp. NPDC051214]|uniref:TrmB family transcriptional regulator n=1 Tax=Streptomyces sp. NPDC051214 TaxID=3155282 RepID=UPI003438AE7F